MTPAQQAAFTPYNTPATEQMVAEKSAQLGALYAVGGITAAGLQAGVSELSRQYNYSAQSLGNIAESATSYVNAFKNTLLGSGYTVEQTGPGGAGYTAKIINSAGVPVSLREEAINSAILGGLTKTDSDLYTIKGPFGTINEIEDAKLRIDPLTGEVGVYTKNNLGQWALSGGIGRYGAQSGEYAIISENTGKSLNLAEISPFWTENLGKVSAPGANIPWSLAAGASGLGTVTEKGLGTSFNIENAANITPSISKLTGAVSSAALAAANPETYAIEGKFGDVSEITGAKIIYNPLTGEAGVYSQRNAIAGMKSSGGQWGLTAGIGMYGAQSGEYTIINEQTGQKTNLATLVEPAISQSNKQYAISLPWNIAGWSAGLSEAVNGTIGGISSAAKGTTTVMPIQIAAAEPTTIVKTTGAQQTGILDQVGSFLSGAVNFWTPEGIAGTKNVVEGSVPIAGDIPYIGSTINSVAAWITPQGMAQVTTPAGLQVQKDASAALSNVQTIKSQYDVAKGQYDTDIAAARAAGYINAQGEITDSKTYAKLSGEIDAVNALSNKLNEANIKYTSVYDTAVKEGLYTVDKSGNYIPTTRAQSSAMDQIDLWASPILKGTGFTVSTDYSKIEQKPVIQTPLYDIYQSFEKNFAQPFTIGAATEFQEKPASAGFNFAVGVGLALATEGFGSVVARSAALSRVGGVVSPTIYTTRAGTGIGLAPAALTGIYAASVPYRATDELTNFEPKEISKNLGGILVTETGPMIAGAYLGTEAYARAAPAFSRGATQFSNWISTPSGGWREEAVFSPGGVGRTLGKGTGLKVTEEGVIETGAERALIYNKELGTWSREIPSEQIVHYDKVLNEFWVEKKPTEPYFEQKFVLPKFRETSSLYGGKVRLGENALESIKEVSPEEQRNLMLGGEINDFFNAEVTGRIQNPVEKSYIAAYKQTPTLDELISGYSAPPSAETQAFWRGRAAEWEDIMGKSASTLRVVTEEPSLTPKISEYGTSLPTRADLVEFEKYASGFYDTRAAATERFASEGTPAYGTRYYEGMPGERPLGQIQIERITGASRAGSNKAIIEATRGTLGGGKSLDELINIGDISQQTAKALEFKQQNEIVTQYSGTGKSEYDVSNMENLLNTIFEEESTRTINNLYGQKASASEVIAENAKNRVLSTEDIAFIYETGKLPERKVIAMDRAMRSIYEEPGILKISPAQEENLLYGSQANTETLFIKGISRSDQAEKSLDAVLNTEYDQSLERVQSTNKSLSLILEGRLVQEPESILSTNLAITQEQKLGLAQSAEQTTFMETILGKQLTTAQTQRLAQTQEQTREQTQEQEQILEQILGKQIVTPDVTRDILGKQITTPVPALSILTGITFPRVTEIPPVEPVKEERKPKKIIWPDLSNLAGGGAGGGGSLSGTVFTERLRLRSMKEVLGVSTFQQQKRKR
jgi:hypothetical protein